MKTHATRECVAHAGVHYTAKNTNHVAAAVTARKHGGINNSRGANNSEGVHTHYTWAFFSGKRIVRRDGSAIKVMIAMVMGVIALTFCVVITIQRKPPSDLERLIRIVPAARQVRGEIGSEFWSTCGTFAPTTLAEPFRRVRPIPVVPDNMQVGGEPARFKLHLFRRPRPEVPIHACLRAKVPHIYAQQSKACGTVLVATIIARMAPPPHQQPIAAKPQPETRGC